MEHKRRRGGRSRNDGKDGVVPDGRSRPIVSHLQKVDMLRSADINALHEASLEILSTTGVVFNNEAAVKHFQQAGARVVGNRVYPYRSLIDGALATAPAEYTLHARNPLNTVRVGGNASVVMPGGGPAFVIDLEGKRRPGTLEDVRNFARLTSMSPQVHVAARKSVEAQDVPVPIRHLECWRSVLTLTDKPVQSGFVGGRAEAEDALEMLSIVFGGREHIQDKPVAHCSVNVNSPLVYDTPMTESLIAFAEAGQVTLISPFVMGGVSGPTTLAGILAQQNAELLAGVALTQLVHPGAPVLYGSASSNVDMRTGAPATGSPECAMSILATAQLARFYGLPSRGGGALTDSPIPDAQSSYERMYTLLTSVMGGINYLMHGVGILESYLTLSYEQFVLDLDMLEMIRSLVGGFVVDEDSLALDAIHKVGPGGTFLIAEHTLERYRDAFHTPRIGVRQGYEQWEAAGAEDASARARRVCQEMLDTYEEPAMDSAVKDRLDEFVAQRIRALLK